MNITVFGASGKVGQLVVQQALADGHTVRAFVHNNDPFMRQGRLTVQKGDVSTRGDVAVALQGNEAVISALGSWGTKQKDIVSSGMKTIIPAMQEQGITRLITVTGTGALWSGDKPGLGGGLSHLFLGLVAPKILRDGEDHLHLLEASDLDWTCVRAPAMVNREGSAYRLDLKLPSLLARVSRQSVARSLLDLAGNKEFLRQAPVIHHA